MISVVVPTYRRPDLLANRCLPSVMAQTVADWECLVVGDGTDDESVALMADLCARDGRFRFWNLTHQTYPDSEHERWCVLGVDALNFGLDHARGDLVTTLADDDEYTPDHCAILQAALGPDIDVAYGLSEVPGHGILGSWPPRHSAFADGSVMWRASMGYRYDRNCLSRGLPADADLWTRMIGDGRRWAFVEQIVHRYYPARVVPPVRPT